MPSPRQSFGSWAETQAVLFLQRKGYTIIAQHLTSRYGEIDILAQDRETVVVVEVKARRSDHFGSAIEAITPKKIESLRLAWDDISPLLGWGDQPCRIDLVAIDAIGPDDFAFKHVLGIG